MTNTKLLLFNMDGLTLDGHNLLYKGYVIISLEELYDYCERNQIKPRDLLEKICKVELVNQKIESVIV